MQPWACDAEDHRDEKLYDEEFLLAHTCAPCLVDKATGEPVMEDPEDPASFVVLDTATGNVVRMMPQTSRLPSLGGNAPGRAVQH